MINTQKITEIIKMCQHLDSKIEATKLINTSIVNKNLKNLHTGGRK